MYQPTTGHLFLLQVHSTVLMSGICCRCFAGKVDDSLRQSHLLCTRVIYLKFPVTRVLQNDNEPLANIETIENSFRDLDRLTSDLVTSQTMVVTIFTSTAIAAYDHRSARRMAPAAPTGFIVERKMRGILQKANAKPDPSYRRLSREKVADCFRLSSVLTYPAQPLKRPCAIYREAKPSSQSQRAKEELWLPTSRICNVGVSLNPCKVVPPQAPR
ncbi:hypothetical protein BR93DRAFT_471843 [Coniochaeta sp. PMI_546]|nr:hypothetical protein BR93DRAFT_471843 [Coniochaeta sp. PMI_546]